MGTPLLLGVPAPVPETTAIAGLLQSLRDDPGLGVIAPAVTIWGPEGDPSQSPAISPAPALVHLPLIRVWPGNYPSRWETEGQHSGVLELQVELIAPGIHYADRFGLWTAFYRAVYPQDAARKALVRARLDPVGNLIGDEIRQAGTATVAIGSDLFAQKTIATLTLKFQIN